MTIDLHIHSTYSDGTFSPTSLVELARAKKVSAISITDHDTMEGTQEALAAGERSGVEVVPGLEMSVAHNSTHLHLLGYYANSDNSDLIQVLKDIQVARISRNSRIIERLNALSLGVSLAEVEAKSTVGQTGRPHIAQVMVEKGYVKNIDQAFSDFLGKSGQAYVPRKVLSASEAIARIRGAGGVAVLAHPATIDNSLRSIPQLVGELVRVGLQGIEVYYPAHTRKIRKRLHTIAESYGLVVTGGSDYHGDIRPGTSIATGTNVFVPPQIIEHIKKRRGR